MDSCWDMKQAFDDVLYVTVPDTWKCLQELGLLHLIGNMICRCITPLRKLVL